MKVYVTQPIAESALERLRARAEVRLNPDPLHIPAKDELVAALRDADMLFCMLHDAVDREVIAAGPRLRAIATMAITPANVDVAEATRRRIPVTVIPRELLDDPTADLAFALLLAVGRRVAEADRFVRTGALAGSQSRRFEAAGISGRTLGILGMGGVGRAAARRARGFSMRVLYHDPRRLSAEEETALGVQCVPFDELFAAADYVSLHVGLTERTRHLIGARELGLMKRSACLINTARGAIVDERALVAALAQGRIAGAGLDVHEHEPRIDPALLAMPNVVLTPHIGSAVVSLRQAMADIAVDNILAVASGERAPNCCNAAIYAAPTLEGV
jgi:glyoxylate reductase